MFLVSLFAPSLFAPTLFAITLPVAILWVVVASAVAAGLILAIEAYVKYRRQMLVTCPENNNTAAVRVDVANAVKQTPYGRDALRLSQCSRWPEHADCGQDCLAQIEADPKACAVWTLVTDWYRDKTCAYCRRPFEEVHWHDRPPALLTPERKTAQWDEIPAEKLPEVFATHKPVCWSCHMAETFRREHPDLVVDRPGHRGPMNEYLTKS